jgi:hypothetical protein
LPNEDDPLLFKIAIVRHPLQLLVPCLSGIHYNGELEMIAQQGDKRWYQVSTADGHNAPFRIKMHSAFGGEMIRDDFQICIIGCAFDDQVVFRDK